MRCLKWKWRSLEARLPLASVAALFSMMLTSCSPTSTANQGTANQQSTAPPPTATAQSPLISTDAKKLGQLITLPYQPLSVVWTSKVQGGGNSSAPGPTDYSLTAVITFKPQDMAKIIASAQKQQPARNYQVPVQEWFPRALQAKAVQDGSGNQIIKGQRLSAQDFYKMSFSNGYLLQVPKTPYLILALYTT